MGWSQVLANEWSRLQKNKKIWILFFLLLILNIVVITLSDSKQDVIPAEYKQIKQQVLGLDVEEQFEILDELAQQDEWDMMLADTYSSSENTAAIQLLEELNTVSGYQDYIDKIQTEAAKNQTLSVFMTSKFALNNLKKTAQDYQQLESVSPSLVGGYGLARVLSSQAINICILFLAAVLVMYSIMEEKKSGVLELYRSARLGREQLCAAKLASVIFMTGLIVLCFFAVNIFYAVYAYGAVDLSAAVQSLYGYDQCSLKLSIGQFLLFYFLLKWLAFIFIEFILFALANLMQNEIFYYCAIGLLFLVELLIYSIGHHIGNMAFLKYFNIIFFLNTEGFFSYYNYNFFGIPLHLLETNLAGILVLCIVLAVFCLYAYKKYSCNYKALSFRHFFAKKRFSQSVFGLEGYKIMYGNKVAVLLIILIIFQAAAYYNKSARWYESELDFRYYMKRIEGEVTSEKLDYIREERERFDALAAQAELYEKQLEQGEISDSEYERLLSDISDERQRENGFVMAESYVEYIESLDCEDKGFVYDRGWWYLAGWGSFQNDIKNGMLMVIGLILALSGMIAQEYQYRMQDLVNISRERNRSTLIKAGISCLLVTFIFLVVYLPELLWVLQEYGLTEGSWSVYSLSFLADFPVHCSIKGYFIIVYLIRYVDALFIGGCVVLLGRILKNINLTTIVAALLFLLPLLLHLMNIEFMDSFSLNKLISGNMLFQ